jgi:nicotinamidase/pyrazinamidase
MNVLLLINLQLDFCPGGSVGMAGGDELIPIANALMPKFDRAVGVRDWHPAEHVSFASTHLWRRPGQEMQVGERTQLLWHMHCVQESFGAEWASGLNEIRLDAIINKGTEPQTDGYSAFANTNLEAYLRARNAEAVSLMGMATEYDVKYTALDAIALGLKTFVLQDACRALYPEKEAEAFAELEKAGVVLSTAEG